jgi:putative endonuclease
VFSLTSEGSGPVRYFVYIMSNKSKTLYTGYTGNLDRRVHEHKSGHATAFTRRYNIGKLVYCEGHETLHQAKMRERQIKGWLRAKKVALVESMNPDWTDLSNQILRPDKYHRDSGLTSRKQG